jgi:sterol desaturase/sphingolipid hydroxylase (fatty acid hydroxylase superfamily)
MKSAYLLIFCFISSRTFAFVHPRLVPNGMSKPLRSHIDATRSMSIETSQYPSIRISNQEFEKETSICRAIFGLLLSAVVINYSVLNNAMQSFYLSTAKLRFFQHYSFEPILSSFVFALNILMYFIIDKYIPRLHKYRIQKSDSMLAWKDRLRDGLSNEVPWYLGFWIPFGGIMKARRISFQAPSLWRVGKEVFLGLLIYDFLFYIGHNCLHRVPFLWNIHSKHHKMEIVRAGDSVRHTFLDGFWDVVCAVAALNILKAHALSRSLFNVVAISLIVEAHSGIFFPWMLCNVIPFSIFAGPVLHDLHHQVGNVNFQKFFTYLDRLGGTVRSVQVAL